MSKKGKHKMEKIVAILILSVIVASFSSCQNSPEPQIKEGEFPFEIVYEIDGETVTINDIYICKFDGFDWNEGGGKHRKWKGYIKSSGEEELILFEDSNLKFAVSVGSPEYYMSDPNGSYSENTPSIYYIKPNEFGGVSSGVDGIEPLLEQYKLKLVSWNFSKPIQNSFE